MRTTTTTTTTTLTTLTTLTGRLRDPSFMDPAVQGRAPPRSDLSSPESGAPIGPRPAHGPAAMARSGLTLHPARHVQAAEWSRSDPRNMNRLAPNSRAVLRRPAEGCAGPACPLGRPRRVAVGADKCACFVRMSCDLSDPGRTACLCLVAAVSRRRCGRMSAIRGRHLAVVPQTLHCLQCHGPICLRCIAPTGRHAGHQFDTPAGAREHERLSLVSLAEALRNGPRWKAVEPRRARMNAENSLVTRALDEVEHQVAAEFRALGRELEALGEEIAALYTHMHTEVAAAYSADTAELNSLLMQRERMLRRYEDFQSQPDTSAYLRSVGTMRAEMESLARTALPPVIVAQIPAAAHARRLSQWATRARNLLSEAPLPPRSFTRRKVLGPYPSQSHLGRLQLVAQALAYTSVASTLAVIVLALAGGNYATVWWIALFIASGAALGLTSLWSWTQGSLRSSGTQASLLSFCLEGPSILPEIKERSVWLARAVIMKIRQETDTALGWFKHLCESWGSYR